MRYPLDRWKGTHAKGRATVRHQRDVLQLVVDVPESLTGLRTPGNGAGGLVVETPGGMLHGDALQANGSAIETPGMIGAGARTDLKVLFEIFELSY